MFDYFVNLWLDQMVLAGFSSARWWAQIANGQPMNNGD